jgi:hypothetical protein
MTVPERALGPFAQELMEVAIMTASNGIKVYCWIVFMAVLGWISPSGVVSSECLNFDDSHFGDIQI